ncbi:MAG: hypothetical protein ACU0CA_12315 [Paracoccaceae bacterium]
MHGNAPEGIDKRASDDRNPENGPRAACHWRAEAAGAVQRARHRDCGFAAFGIDAGSVSTTAEQ